MPTTRLDLAAIRERVELVAETLELPSDAVRLAMADPERQSVIQFGAKYGQNLDWLLLGDLRGLIREGWRRHGVKPDMRLSA